MTELLSNVTIDEKEAKVRPVAMLVSVGGVYGGAESYYGKLVRILLPDFRIVAVVCNRRLGDELRTLGVKVECPDDSIIPSSLSRYFFALKACRRMILRHHPRIAHLNGQPESYLALFLRLMGLRLLTTRHTPFTDLYLREGSRLPIVFKRWMALMSLRFVHRTICVSQLLTQQLAQHHSADRLVNIPTWIASEYLEEYRRPSPSQPLRVLFVGRVVRNKGIFEAIEAVRHCPSIHLTVAGEGDDLERARELARGLAVTFVGFQRDCRPLYKSSDLLLFPSPEGFEGLPQVPLEAMAMGVPCLASDISSIREICGKSGALAMYRQGDIGDLSAKLAELAGDHKGLTQLGEAGRAEIERRFTESAVAGANLQQFHSAVQNSLRHRALR